MQDPFHCQSANTLIFLIGKSMKNDLREKMFW